MKAITLLGIFLLSTECYGRTRTPTDYNPFPRYPHYNTKFKRTIDGELYSSQKQGELTRHARGISWGNGNSMNEETHPFRLINRPTTPKPYRNQRSINYELDLVPEYQSNFENEPTELTRMTRGTSRHAQPPRYINRLPPPKTRYARSVAEELDLEQEHQNNFDNEQAQLVREARWTSNGKSFGPVRPTPLINRPPPPKPHRYARSVNDELDLLPEYQTTFENEPTELTREVRWAPRGNSRSGQTQQIRYVDGLPPPKQTRYVRSAHEFGLAPEYQNNFDEKVSSRHARNTYRHHQPYHINKQVPPRPKYSV